MEVIICVNRILQSISHRLNLDLVPSVAQPQLVVKVGTQVTAMRAKPQCAIAGASHRIILPIMDFREQVNFTKGSHQCDYQTVLQLLWLP